MDMFKKAWRLCKISKCVNMVFTGLLSMVFMNEVMAVLGLLMPEAYSEDDMLFVMNMCCFNGLWASMILGNFDVNGHCRQVHTSNMRRFMYMRFYPAMSTVFAVGVFLADFLTRLTVGAAVGTGADIWGGRSLMTAIFLALGAIVMGVLSASGVAAGLIISVGLVLSLVALAAAAEADISAFLPGAFTENAAVVLLLGILIILAGEAAGYFIRRRRSVYRHSSSPRPGSSLEGMSFPQKNT